MAQADLVQFVPEGTHAITVPADHGVELQARFNGQGPIHVIFDTGSTNVMSAALAKKLGLSVGGTGNLDANGGTVPVQGTIVERVQIGGVILHHQVFAVIELPSHKNEELAFIGNQWLQHLPIRVDFGRQRITFYNPQFFHYAGDGTSLPIHFDMDSVIVKATVDGISGQFLLDSGSIHSLLLNAPFVKQHDLANRYHAPFRGYAGEGWGGPDTGAYTRVGTLSLGNLTVNRPITVLLEDTQGTGASQLAGNIGLRILRRFVVIFDGPNGNVYLEKSSEYEKPDIFNRAGFVVDPDPDDARIRMVVPGSPAADIGLVENDVVIGINGKPPTDDALETAFSRPAGTHLSLTLRHDGRFSRTVSLILRDVL